VSAVVSTPRTHVRGLIEADPPPCRSPDSRGLRGLTSAASLKRPTRSAGWRTAAPGLRGLTSAASLKRPTRSAGWRTAAPGLRGLTSAASLKRPTRSAGWPTAAPRLRGLTSAASLKLVLLAFTFIYNLWTPRTHVRGLI